MTEILDSDERITAKNIAFYDAAMRAGRADAVGAFERATGVDLAEVFGAENVSNVAYYADSIPSDDLSLIHIFARPPVGQNETWRRTMKRKLAALLLAALCALGAVGLVGCGGPSVEEVIREGVTAEFEAVVDTESEEYQELVDALEQAGDLATYGVDEKAFMDSMYDGFAYEIGDIAVDEEAGTAVVDVKLTCKTFAEIFNTMMELSLIHI